ncbi:DUF1906 domain-containing protein [Streptomyces vilmorinianum]|uniref:DUF1906 domain-containing protein n=1 Tax=Streptomyces vilmorinianum TaxID=3051092 RepID=UPI0010FB2EEF|nr:DUF1906 domain-containing protein [Streptomyces vilmorinianum]
MESSPAAVRPRHRSVQARALAPALVAALAATLLAAPAAADPATADPATADLAIADPATADPATADLATAAPATADPAKAVPGARAAPDLRFLGRAFDTCEAPSLTVMKAWRASPYRAVGIYIGGRGRGCLTQQHLNAAWVESVHAMGWRLLPLFVGSQAPCVIAEDKRDVPIGRTPWAQGTQEAAEAVKAARALGIAPSSPLYLDMEAYRITDLSCAATTLLFVRAWNREVHRLGFLPGFYSSADSGVRHMEEARKAGAKDLPAVIWFARWGGTPALFTEPVLPSTAWREHGRIHQYAGNVTESHGGSRMMIDRNEVDAPAALVQP